jgi:hypothetical protein
MLKSVLRFVRTLRAVMLALCLSVLPEGCAHVQPLCSEGTDSSNTMSATEPQKSEPPFRSYHHLGHSHFRRTDPVNSGDS